MPYSDAGYGVLKTGSGVVTAAEILSIAREFSLDAASRESSSLGWSIFPRSRI